MSELVKATRSLLQGANFALSVPDLRRMPPDRGCEVAFAGRSNSGKSSALNVLCGQRALARTSRTPGRTQHLVVFELDAGRRLVDLPGFGYAKVSKTLRAHWERELPAYLERRRTLTGVVLLMDVRHPLKDQELTLIDWAGASGVPLHVLLNKADKLGRGAQATALRTVTRHLVEHGGPLASVQLFSALRHQGLEEAWAVIGGWLATTPPSD
ncbi:MAG: ribosome biogenesis GTP-binding protein YihA/YsxC [Gammaproteobacteria bacterium]